ncbi:PREDICTED: uncharacterized protein LOC104586969 [Nelumbo nucifera]|uniref:RPM1-interacting protein 4-like n=2 Tax=Nelumbo nucifera TaxID=4432 RepID=A0A822YYA9_NELNU|nr:PREDICTED: uncharacterized protein LOC104586969 [Nelumbo nucifera]DAD39074.1 TPA_asm: hypothetical protein HUJ06_013397 [Nelumbo nucifera]
MDFEHRRSHIPAFGNWDYTDDLPVTQCFQSARQAGLLCYSASYERDLYVIGDLYGHDDLEKPPRSLVVPLKTKGTEERYTQHVNQQKKQGSVYDMTETPLKQQPPYLHSLSSLPPPPRAPKPVDEDLYRISPDLLYSKPKRKRMFEFFSSCLLPTCVV